MLRDKTRIDRRRELREDCDRQRWLQIMRQIHAELNDDECLGEPFRAPIGIIIPIELRRPEDK